MVKLAGVSVRECSSGVVREWCHEQRTTRALKVAPTLDGETVWSNLTTHLLLPKFQSLLWAAQAGVYYTAKTLHRFNPHQYDDNCPRCWWPRWAGRSGSFIETTWR